LADGIDDVDWTIDLKEQLTQMSQMLRQWRKNFKDMSDLYPYGKQWDIFYFGHCFDVPISRQLPLTTNR